MILCSADEELPPDRELLRPYFGMHRFEWDGTGGIEFHLGYGDWIRLLRENGFAVENLIEIQAPSEGAPHRYAALRTATGRSAGPPRRSGSPASVRERPARTAAPPRLDLAAAAAILEQLGIPFELAAPDYEEHDPPDADVVALVREHAAGKARSVGEPGRAARPRGRHRRPLDGRVFGKPSGPEEAEEMLEALGGRTHEVVSGLCLRTPGWEVVEHEVTR